MQRIPSGTTTYEQMPREFRSLDAVHPASRTPWAWIIIAMVIVVFGAFWYIESRQQRAPVMMPVASALQQLPVPIDTQPPTNDLGVLQAAVINSAIPDFSKDF